ncbi:MAG: alpha/beta hydrolase [Proteobacteria bacterium]|nr:alpha/beta hydrolase [Pseudomonadota bacterium]
MKPLDRYALPSARALLNRLLVDMDVEARAMSAPRPITVQGAAGPLPARLYEPDPSAPPGPAMLFFHGGGFVFCSPETHDALCRRLAAASGWRILSCGYRLAPEYPFPAQHEDAVAAARWTLAHAQELKFDPARLAFGGDSAGAHLALWAATDERLAGKAALLVLLYPLLTLDDAEWSGSIVKDMRLLGRTAVAYIRRQLQTREGAALELGPKRLARAPAALIVSGGPLDPVRPDAHPFAERLRAAGVAVTERDFPGLVHGSFNLTHLSQAARDAVAETGRTAAALLSR